MKSESMGCYLVFKAMFPLMESDLTRFHCVASEQLWLSSCSVFDRAVTIKTLKHTAGVKFFLGISIRDSTVHNIMKNVACGIFNHLTVTSGNLPFM